MITSFALNIFLGSLTLLTRLETMDPQYKLLDVVRCGICETPVPPVHCDICHINLCKACVGEHISDELNDHKTVSFSKRGDNVNFPRCQTHRPKICELHCKHCNIPICALCVSSGDHEHHKKDNILKHLIIKKEAIKKDLSELQKSIYPEYKKCATNLIFQKANVKKHSRKLMANLNKQAKALHAEINTIVQGMKSDIDDMDAQHMTAIDEQEDKVNHNITEIKQIIQDLQNLLQTNDVKLVFNYTSRNEEFRNVPTQFHLTLPTFMPQEINTEEIREQIRSLLDQVLSFPAKQLIDDPSATTKKHSDPKKTRGPLKTQDAFSSLSTKQLIDDPAITTEEHADPIETPGNMSSSPARPLINDPSSRRYMAGILPIRRKNQNNQSINDPSITIEGRRGPTKTPVAMFSPIERIDHLIWGSQIIYGIFV